MAIQSVKSGNNSTQTVGFAFLAVFVVVVPPLLIMAMSALWKVARTEPRLLEAFMSLKVQGPLVTAASFSALLVILYGDMNLSVMSRRVIGLGFNISEFCLPKRFETCMMEEYFVLVEEERRTVKY
jgi:hypothetical protein